MYFVFFFFFFFSSRRRHTRWTGDWSSDVCSSDLTSRIGTRCGSAVPILPCPECSGNDRTWIFSDRARGGEMVRFYSTFVFPHLCDWLLSRPVIACQRRALLRSEERRVGKECRSRW